MALYTVNSGKVVSATNAAKVSIQLATGSGVTAKLVGFSVSFDGVDSTKTPVLVELVKETGASSGGAGGTLTQVGGGAARTAQTTARINDTSDGSAPTVLDGWLVSPTALYAYQWPLGREIEIAASSFLAIRLTTVTASGSPNYNVTAYVEE